MTSIHKSFLVSLAAFLGISVVFQIINLALTDAISTLTDDPVYIVVMLFEGIVNSVFFGVAGVFQGAAQIFNALEAGGDLAGPLGTLCLNLGFVLAPLIAAVIAGLLAESKVDAFFGWLLTIIVCWLVWTIFYVVDVGVAATEYESTAQSLTLIFLGSLTSVGLIWAILLMLSSSLITCFSYGVLSLAARKETFY
jgi:hypothetical protein